MKLSNMDLVEQDAERALAETEIRAALYHVAEQGRGIRPWERYFLSHAISAFLQERYRAAAVDAREILNDRWNSLGPFNLIPSEFETLALEEYSRMMDVSVAPGVLTGIPSLIDLYSRPA